MDYDSFYRASRTKPWRCDWSSDGCSEPMPLAGRVMFARPCLQHDFGYRNYGHGLALGRNEADRKWIDDRFLTEMVRLCGPLNYICVSLTAPIYAAVRNGGRDSFYNG